MVKKTVTKILLFLSLTVNGCSSALLTTPEILTGGLNTTSVEEHPAYSGDGRYLAFASDRSGRRSIYLFDLQNRQLVSLPNLNRRDSSQDQPSLSADGRFIAYVSTERGKTDIMVYDRLSSRSELLSANVKGSVARPTITGDGRKVAFATNETGQWKIVLVERNSP